MFASRDGGRAFVWRSWDRCWNFLECPERLVGEAGSVSVCVGFVLSANPPRGWGETTAVRAHIPVHARRFFMFMFQLGFQRDWFFFVLPFAHILDFVDSNASSGLRRQKSTRWECRGFCRCAASFSNYCPLKVRRSRSAARNAFVYYFRRGEHGMRPPQPLRIRDRALSSPLNKHLGTLRLRTSTPSQRLIK